MRECEVIIAGGGASGLFAAYLTASAGIATTVLEKNTVTGKKLSMTGNGRGNLSNLETDASFYNEAARPLLNNLLQRYGVKETIAHFRETGVLLREEEGALFPVSGQASEVVSALTRACIRKGACIRTGTQIKSVTPRPGGGYDVRTDEETYPARFVILATGGLSGPKSTMSTGDGYYIAKQLGMRLTERYPALVRLLTKDTDLTGEKGVRAHARISFFADDALFACETGEVQLTDRTLSGIPVMQASADCAMRLGEGAKVRAVIDFFPETTREAFDAMCKERLLLFADETVSDILCGMGNEEINQAVIKRLQIKPDTKIHKLSDQDKNRLFSMYRAYPVTIDAADAYAHAQTTRGGVSMESLTASLECLTAPGVYVTGELADADGRCGGYNLQWAWTSAMCAAADIISKAL